MRLKTVVFPAPFGPMRAVMVGRSTANPPPPTARRPRNVLLTSSTTSSDTSELPRFEPQRARQWRPQSVRKKDRHHQQEHAVNGLADAGDIDSAAGEDLRGAIA